TMAKGLNAGRAAENGVLAAKLAANGFTASQNIFDDPMGFFAAACGDRVERRLLRFGKPFFFAQPGVAIKLYPCAGVLHPALDILIKLRARHRIDAAAVSNVSIELDAEAARPLVYDRPLSGLESKFSLPFAAAVALVDGAAGLVQFTDPRVSDPAIGRLMKRVTLLRREPAKKAPRSGIATAVEIELKNGSVLGARDVIARGHPLRPAARTEVEDKFIHCAHGILPPRQIRQLLKSFWRVDRAPSIGAWLRPLRAARR
ncbi:MAG: MmgE/PrpD family protein, partial [Deltaproteobacteria bacterium]|nr:MmgE/PrpD family protein [Deltaproteobacteria bacterium]